MKNTKELGTEPIMKLLMKFSIPAIIAMLVNAIYNIVDRIFIGKYVGEDALAGLTVAFPMMMIIFAFAALVGQGGANIISIKLGEKDIKKANHVLGNTLSMGLFFGVLIISLGYCNLDYLLNKFGADEVTLSYGHDYMSIILLGIIFQIIAFTLNNTVRAEGFPALSMYSMVISAVSNLILDYVLIIMYGMGVEGAAIATIAGQFIGFCFLVFHFISGKSIFKIRGRHFVPDKKVIMRIMGVGAATFVMTIGTSVSMTLLNVSLGKYGGNSAITSMGAINSLYTLFIMPIMGIQGGMQPIIGYNHGAKLYARVKETLVKGIGIGSAFATIVFIFLEVFPTAFIGLFLDENSSTILVANEGLRIFVIMLPILSINMFGMAYFQAIASSRKAMFLGSLRQLIYLVPLVFVLPRFLGLKGVWLAAPIADFLAIVTSVIMLLPVFAKTKKSMVN